MLADCTYEPPGYYFHLVKPYRDRFGLITQVDKDMDGGDAAHRTGVFFYGMYLQYKNQPEELSSIKKSFLGDLAKIRVARGKYVRHPDSEKWYSNPHNFSRDQTTPIVIALGAFGERSELLANFSQLVESKSFYPNKLKNWTNEEKRFPFDYRDVAGPSDLGMYIRALQEKNYHHLLYFTDLQLLANAFVRIGISYWDDHDTSDDVNFTLLLLQAEEVMPTPISHLSKWIYTRFRKVSPFATEKNADNPVASAWEYYFTYVQERPPLHMIYQCSLSKFNN